MVWQPAAVIMPGGLRHGRNSSKSVDLMTARSKKWLSRFLRYGVAVVGIYLVVINIRLDDHVLVWDVEANRAIEASVEHGQPDPQFPLTVHVSGERSTRQVTEADLMMRPDRRSVSLINGRGKAAVLGVVPRAKLAGRPEGASVPHKILIQTTGDATPVFITPEQVEGGYTMEVEYPLREIGLRRMVNEAKPQYLYLAVAIFPLTYLLTSVRWYLLLRVLGVRLGKFRTLRLNMVGAFYNTFMPGSTGGDVLKAYYAANNAVDARTRAVVSVVVDRVVGLLALMLMGGVAAAFQSNIPQCRNVAIITFSILGGIALCVVVARNKTLRKALGIDFLVGRLPMQEQVQKATGALDVYAKNWPTCLAALAISLPVHATVVVSASLCGKAFGLPLSWGYYWVVVPVVVLSGSLPISPQGAGVMEFFAVLLTRPRSCTIAQAVALTLSIRMVQIIWNLAGAAFLVGGNFHRPKGSTSSSDAEPTVEPTAAGA